MSSASPTACLCHSAKNSCFAFSVASYNLSAWLLRCQLLLLLLPLANSTHKIIINENNCNNATTATLFSNFPGSVLGFFDGFRYCKTKRLATMEGVYDNQISPLALLTITALCFLVFAREASHNQRDRRKRTKEEAIKWEENAFLFLVTSANKETLKKQTRFIHPPRSCTAISQRNVYGGYRHYYYYSFSAMITIITILSLQHYDYFE